VASGETRRLVYFDVELKLKRDFDFGAWDAPGVAGIVSALGTGPKGITGIINGGNKAGDTLVAHGSAVYRREADRWIPLASGGFSPAQAPAYATNAVEGPAALLEAMRKILESTPKEADSAERAVIQEELTAAHAIIRARLARVTEGYAIAAGPEHGQYLRFAKSLPPLKNSRTIALVTRGSEENLRLLRDGKVSLAFSQADAALAAYTGKANFADEGPYPRLRAIGSLYPEPVHVLVRANSPIRSIADLKGRAVAIGVPGSASRTTVLTVLEAHGLRANDYRAIEVPLGEALVTLRSQSVDAVMQVIGTPADSVRDALSAVSLRLVPLSQKVIETLAKAEVGYFAATIPRGSYSNQSEDVATIATAAVLLTSAELSDSEVAAITRYIYQGGRDLLARGTAQGPQVSAANARFGLSIPLHDAAAKALDTMK